MRLHFPLSALLALALPCAFAQTQPPQAATLTIDAGAAKAKSSPTLYGLMTEEINSSYDGGLYGELVRNRVVQKGWGGTDHWAITQRGLAQAALSVDTATGPSAAITSSMKLAVTAAAPGSPAGVENEGYWGIPVRPNTRYQASFYAKSSRAGTAVTVTLLNDDTGKPLAQQTIRGIGTDWKQYSTTLQTGDMQTAGLQSPDTQISNPQAPNQHRPGPASPRNHLVLSVTAPGTLWITLASLFPPTYHDRPNGNRIDLMEKLAAMHPAFLRFPGGNYLEGDRIVDRYDWKKTIGPLVDRPTHPSPWQYRSSDGLGLLEFLEWCEDLHMQPVLAVYAGYSLKGDHVDPGATLQPYVQDALDEIEYATGDAATRWGAERVKNGHPAPFKLRYVELGNEDWFDRSGSYEGRYAQFYDAIKQRYPQLQLIATTPVKGHAMDVLDDHYYRSAQEFFTDVHHYDSTDRTGPKIFVGEWATREGLPTPNFGAALGDAAWMTGMERNSDIIVLSSYAPLLTNVNPGGSQWDTDLIGYDAMTSYGSPSYYAQVLFSQHHGDEILNSSFTGSGADSASSAANSASPGSGPASSGSGPASPGATPVRLFQSVTRDSATGALFIKLVNAATLPATVTLNLTNTGPLSTTAHIYTLSAPSTEVTNSITDPQRIVPVEHDLKQLGSNFPLTLQPLSINVIEVPTRH